MAIRKGVLSNLNNIHVTVMRVVIWPNKTGDAHGIAQGNGACPSGKWLQEDPKA
jgi:hypothetical protein